MHTPEYVWQSSVLRVNDDDPDCKLCAFVNGDRSQAVMLEVIRVLDAALAVKEVLARALVKSAVERTENDRRSE